MEERRGGVCVCVCVCVGGGGGGGREGELGEEKGVFVGEEYLVSLGFSNN